MFRLLDGCKFNNCVHIGEPSCAVKNAVEEGEVSEERYVNYLEMYETFEEDPYRCWTLMCRVRGLVSP